MNLETWKPVRGLLVGSLSTSFSMAESTRPNVLSGSSCSGFKTQNEIPSVLSAKEWNFRDQELSISCDHYDSRIFSDGQMSQILTIGVPLKTPLPGFHLY